jgi:hypothetical protein
MESELAAWNASGKLIAKAAESLDMQRRGEDHDVDSVTAESGLNTSIESRPRICTDATSGRMGTKPYSEGLLDHKFRTSLEAVLSTNLEVRSSLAWPRRCTV